MTDRPANEKPQKHDFKVGQQPADHNDAGKHDSAKSLDEVRHHQETSKHSQKTKPSVDQAATAAEQEAMKFFVFTQLMAPLITGQLVEKNGHKQFVPGTTDIAQYFGQKVLGSASSVDAVMPGTTKRIGNEFMLGTYETIAASKPFSDEMQNMFKPQNLPATGMESAGSFAGGLAIAGATEFLAIPAVWVAALGIGGTGAYQAFNPAFKERNQTILDAIGGAWNAPNYYSVAVPAAKIAQVTDGKQLAHETVAFVAASAAGFGLGKAFLKQGGLKKIGAPYRAQAKEVSGNVIKNAAKAVGVDIGKATGEGVKPAVKVDTGTPTGGVNWSDAEATKLEANAAAEANAKAAKAKPANTGERLQTAPSGWDKFERPARTQTHVEGRIINPHNQHPLAKPPSDMPKIEVTKFGEAKAGEPNLETAKQRPADKVAPADVPASTADAGEKSIQLSPYDPAKELWDGLKEYNQSRSGTHNISSASLDAAANYSNGQLKPLQEIFADVGWKMHLQDGKNVLEGPGNRKFEWPQSKPEEHSQPTRLDAAKEQKFFELSDKLTAYKGKDYFRLHEAGPTADSPGTNRIVFDNGDQYLIDNSLKVTATTYRNIAESPNNALVHKTEVIGTTRMDISLKPGSEYEKIIVDIAGKTAKLCKTAADSSAEAVPIKSLGEQWRQLVEQRVQKIQTVLRDVGHYPQAIQDILDKGKAGARAGEANVVQGKSNGNVSPETAIQIQDKKTTFDRAPTLDWAKMPGYKAHEIPELLKNLGINKLFSSSVNLAIELNPDQANGITTIVVQKGNPEISITGYDGSTSNYNPSLHGAAQRDPLNLLRFVKLAQEAIEQSKQ